MKLNDAMNFEGYIDKTSAVKGGGLFASITMETDVTMNKKSRASGEANPYLGRVKKVTHIHGDCLITGTQYEKLVNNRRVREGLAPDFKVEKPSGRHHIENSQAITQADKNDNQYYMNLYFLKTESRIDTSYVLDGEEIDLHKYADYLAPNFFEPKTEGEKQGLENPIVIRTPKLESITKVKCGDFHFSE